MTSHDLSTFLDAARDRAEVRFTLGGEATTWGVPVAVSGGRCWIRTRGQLEREPRPFGLADVGDVQRLALTRGAR